jgi:uncharacterized LabA/DUF88 family protein
MTSKNQKAYKENNLNNNNMPPSDRNGSLDDSFIFIDAGFLSKLSKYFGKGKYIVYDLIKFCENISKKQKLNCNKIFYYTAPPFQSNAPTEKERERKDRYDTFIKKLSKNPKIEIREGRCQRLINKNGHVKYSQKAVDSLMVIDLMKIPLKYPNLKKISLIACDSDFVPVINELKEIGIEIILFTYFTKKRDTNFSRSSYLNNVVNKYVRLSKEDFDKAKLIKEN